MRGDLGRCGEMWGDVGRSGEIWRDLGRSGEIWGDLGRYRCLREDWAHEVANGEEPWSGVRVGARVRVGFRVSGWGGVRVGFRGGVSVGGERNR